MGNKLNKYVEMYKRIAYKDSEIQVGQGYYSYPAKYGYTIYSPIHGYIRGRAIYPSAVKAYRVAVRKIDELKSGK